MEGIREGAVPRLTRAGDGIEIDEAWAGHIGTRDEPAKAAKPLAGAEQHPSFGEHFTKIFRVLSP